jgi:hypothetical protein
MQERMESLTGHDSSIPSSRPALVGTLILMVAPAALIVCIAPTSARYVLFGAASWAVAVLAKIGIAKHSAIRRPSVGSEVRAFVWGLLSGLIELTSTAAVIWAFLETISANDVVALGIGVSSAEIIYILVVAMNSRDRMKNDQALEKWSAGAKRSLCVRYMLFIERLSAFLVHVGTRGLIYLALIHHHLWPAAVALLSFAVVDGMAVYGKFKCWYLYYPMVANPFYAFATLIGICDSFLFYFIAFLR